MHVAIVSYRDARNGVYDSVIFDDRRPQIERVE
jgi:hypothetical protein